MKTDPAAETAAPAKAANLSLADLSKALAKPKSAPAPETETETETDVSTEEDRETPPGAEAAETTDSTVLSQTDADASETEETESTEGGEGETETEPGETTEASEETETTEETETASVADTVRRQLETELKPLIAELTKAGSKGALQVLLKRLPKLTDQRDTERNKRLMAESRVSELETELEAAKSEKPEPRSGNGQSGPDKYSAKIAEVDSFIRLFRANPDGVELDDGKGGKVSLSAEDVADHLERLRDQRTELVTERKLNEQTARTEFQRHYQQFHTLAGERYPWLLDTESPEHTRMKAVLKAIPGLKDLPDHELIIARMFRGKAVEEAEAKAKGKPPATRKAPPARTPTQVSTATPAAKAGPADPKKTAQKEVETAEAQFKKTGKQADLQKLEAAKARLRRLGS